MYKHYTHLV